ncbi:MAG: LLM class flavin-dependent oxidoreductase [Chloroflexi bacterium]|nr:LLM class flavin-dependent oxidoreductase [Chloroflexota bacterium]
MNFGIFFELEVGTAGYTERDIWHNALTQIEYAEKWGFDSAYAVEHHFNPGYSHSSCPEILFAAASQRTKKMRLGTGVQLLPINHPVRVAEHVAALDILTDGRYDFGIGRGTFAPEFETFKAPPAQGDTKDENRRMFFECVEIIKKCWTKDSFTHEGEFYQFPTPIRVVPKPVQKPIPRIFAACGSPDSYVMYPKAGFHVMPTTAVTPLDHLGKSLPAAYNSWKEAGNDKKLGPLQVNCLVPVYVAETREQAIEQMKPWEMWYFERLVEFFAPRNPKEREAMSKLFPAGSKPFWENPTWDYIMGERMVICGDPDDVIEQIKEYEDAGINRLMAQFQLGGMPHRMVMESMKLWSEAVLPAFEKKGKKAAAVAG